MSPKQVPLAVNGKWLVRPLTGTGRYSTEAVKALLRTRPEIQVVVPSDAVIPDWLEGCPLIRSRFKGQFFEQVALPWTTRRAMLLNLSGPAPLLARRQLVVMHDATPFRFPAAFSHVFVLWYRFMYRMLASGRTRLVTVSHFSAGELATVLHVPPARFTVAAPAASTGEDGGTRPRMDLPDRFFLAVGTLARNKNLVPAISALSAAGHPVVVVGTRGADRVFHGGGEELQAGGVHLAGRVTDGELAWLYQHAVALVFPSLYEGFGLPLLEAQTHGCPVITSDRAAMPEVCRDSALYFDPNRLSDLIDAATRTWQDESVRERLIAAGKKNVARYSWNATAKALLGACNG